MSERVVLTDWVKSEGFELLRVDVNIKKALLAERRLPTSRYGKTQREA